MVAGAALSALSIAIGNTLEYLFAYLALRWFFHIQLELNRVRDVTALLITSVISPTVAASAGVFGVWLVNKNTYEGALKTWGAWWLGDAIGLLIVTPFVLLWSKADNRQVFKTRPIESAVFVLVLAMVAALFFKAIDPTLMPERIFPYLIFPILNLGFPELRTNRLRNVDLRYFLSGHLGRDPRHGAVRAHEFLKG